MSGSEWVPGARPMRNEWSVDLHTETKVISHVSVIHENGFGQIYRKVFFTDGTCFRSWPDAEVTNQLADRSLIGVELKITFNRKTIVRVER